MATATEAEKQLVIQAINFLRAELVAELLATKTTDSQWAAIISWLEDHRKEVKNAGLHARIDELQSEIEE